MDIEQSRGAIDADAVTGHGAAAEVFSDGRFDGAVYKFLTRLFVFD